jgi:hypothetical protein
MNAGNMTDMRDKMISQTSGIMSQTKNMSENRMIARYLPPNASSTTCI